MVALDVLATRVVEQPHVVQDRGVVPFFLHLQPGGCRVARVDGHGEWGRVAGQKWRTKKTTQHNGHGQPTAPKAILNIRCVSAAISDCHTPETTDETI